MATHANIEYDLSGTLAGYKKEDLRFVIFENDQRIEFGEPVFINSIVVTKSVGTGWVPVTQGAADGWTFVDGIDTDSSAKSDAMLKDKTFNGVLVKSIVVKIFNSTNTKATVSVSYQRLRKDLNESFTYDGNGPEYSPALMAKVLERIEYLSSKSNTVTDMFGSSLEDHTLLEQDLTGTNVVNLIQQERHTINVPGGRMFISPDRGSFYKHDVVVQGFTPIATTITSTNKVSFYGKLFIYTEDTYNAALNTTTSKEKRVVIRRSNVDNYVGFSGTIAGDVVTWVEGVDYKIIGVNLAKTKVSSHTSGVYEHIQVLKAYVGDVFITYRAFGGSVSTQDVLDMHKNLKNLVSVIKGSGLLTDKSVYTHPIVREMIDRLNAMEEFHHHYAQIEHIISVRDNAFHWYNIAFIYDNRWDGLEDALNDLGSFRIESMARNWAYEFNIITDLESDTGRQLRVKTLACSDTNIVNNFKNYAILDNHDNVYLRLCWVGDGKTSGVVLQYGMKFDKFALPINGVETETLIVTNKSGRASRWRLYSNPLEMDYPADDNFSTPVYHENANDDNFTMPNGYTRWQSSNVDCSWKCRPLEPEDGMIYWAGNMPMHLLMEEHSSISPFYSNKVRHELQQMVRDPQLTAEQVSSVSFDIFDRFSSSYFTVESPCRINPILNQASGYWNQVGCLNVHSGQEVIFSLQDMCGLRYTISTSIDSLLVMSVITSLGTNSIINERFDLRQIRLHFN